ncbi:MAG: MHS family MFS transporter [Xanthobacteraceae bacterium]|nr:MHS family MFS transporter [Xanthobacteraceae bacterium]
MNIAKNVVSVSGQTLREEKSDKRSLRTVALACLIGTTIEWYDFFIFSSLTAIVFNKLFFPAADPVVSTILAYATFAVGFVVRPVGGAIWGHFGDKLGRRPVLIFALMLMGITTFLIGLLPTYAQAGTLAPLTLLFLRVLQGVALGGEWGGAVLMAYEHAGENERARYSSFPQIGLALGLCLSTAIIAGLSNAMSGEAFLQWGWRIPFLLSILLLGAGIFIRLRVLETPDFLDAKSKIAVVNAPAAELVGKHKVTLLLAWAANMIMGVVFAIYAVYVIPMLSQLGYSRGAILSWISISGFILVFTIPYAASLADRFGVRRIFFWGALLNAAAAFPSFWIMRYSGNQVFTAFAIIVSFGVLWAPVYGPLAALYCDLFETRVRYTGISVAYQIGAVFSVSLTPLVATTLATQFHNGVGLIPVYIVAAGLLSAASIVLMNRRN